MTMPKTETTETSKLESAIGGLVEAEVSSEEETVEEKPIEETEETEEKEEAEELKLTPEHEAEINRRAKAQSDESLKNYQAKRESDTAEIRRLNDALREAKAAARETRDSKLLKVLRDSGEEEGETESTIQNREDAVKEFLDREKHILENEAEITETAEFITKMAEGIDEAVANEFGLNDPNPLVKAKGGMALISEAVKIYQEMAAFKAILEEVPVLKQGSDVRKQIDEMVEQYLDPELGKKGRRRLLDDLKRDFKATPKEKPGTPVSSSITESPYTTGKPVERIEKALNAQSKKG